jgi:hypothetical protein
MHLICIKYNIKYICKLVCMIGLTFINHINTKTQNEKGRKGYKNS